MGQGPIRPGAGTPSAPPGWHHLAPRKSWSTGPDAAPDPLRVAPGTGYLAVVPERSLFVTAADRGELMEPARTRLHQHDPPSQAPRMIWMVPIETYAYRLWKRRRAARV